MAPILPRAVPYLGPQAPVVAVGFAVFRAPLPTGAHAVVGASPRLVSLNEPSCFVIRIAFVVVLPQSVARMVRISGMAVEDAPGAGWTR